MPMRNGNPDTRRRHVFETAVEMLTETETINLDDLVEQCNMARSMARKQFSGKSIGNLLAPIVNRGGLIKESRRVNGLMCIYYTLGSEETWKQVDIPSGSIWETWTELTGPKTKNAGTTSTI